MGISILLLYENEILSFRHHPEVISYYVSWVSSYFLRMSYCSGGKLRINYWILLFFTATFCCLWCADGWPWGRVVLDLQSWVRCWNLTHGCYVPTATQHAIPLVSVNKYRQKLGVNGHTMWCNGPVSKVLQLWLVCGWGLQKRRWVPSHGPLQHYFPFTSVNSLSRALLHILGQLCIFIIGFNSRNV